MQKMVIALIQDEEGSYLIGKRPKEEPSPSLWEFPGGMIEGADTIQNTLQRIMREKIGVEVKILSELPHFNHSPKSGEGINIVPYACRTLGMPKRKYHDAIRWAPIDEMKSIRFVDGSDQIIGYLEKTSI
jgi:8-oxo-dGTP diphosphatase